MVETFLVYVLFITKNLHFSVSPDKQIFHCFGCGVGGNAISFISKIEGIGFKEAIEVLAERANIQLPTIANNIDNKKEELKSKVYKVNAFTADYYHKKLYQKESKIAQEYIKQRKINNETLESFKIGFSGNFDELYQALKKEGFGEEEILESGLVTEGSIYDNYAAVRPVINLNKCVIDGGCYEETEEIGVCGEANNKSEQTVNVGNTLSTISNVLLITAGILILSGIILLRYSYSKCQKRKK